MSLKRREALLIQGLEPGCANPKHKHRRGHVPAGGWNGGVGRAVIVGMTARPGSTFQPLFGARALAEWTRQGGAPARAPLGHGLRLKWHALWFELNWRTQLERMPPGPPPADPVFILGLWRSGTTVLHELVNACGG